MSDNATILCGVSLDTLLSDAARVVPDWTVKQIQVDPTGPSYRVILTSARTWLTASSPLHTHIEDAFEAAYERALDMEGGFDA